MSDEYSVSRVPANQRQPFLGLILVHMGMLTALDQFMLGAMLGHSMSFAHAYTAILVASAIFCVLTFGLGYAGMREGLSCSLLARWCGFGRIGAVLIGLILSVSLLGWFGVQNSVFAKGLNHALHDRLGFPLAAMLSGTFLTLLVAFGFKALRFTARFAVPFFILAIGYVSVAALSGHPLASWLHQMPTGELMSVSQGITAIVGGFIVASLITPDISRFCHNGKQVLLITLLTVFVGEFMVNGLAICLAHALNTADVVTIMSQAGGGIGLLIVIFSTLRINDINLYSSSLGIANAVEGLTGIKINYTALTIIVGLLGTTLSVLGILDRFVDFLDLLGVTFPPIIGIMLVEYYLIKTHRQTLDKSGLKGCLPSVAETPKMNLNAIIVCLIASIIGFKVSWGIPALNALLAASILYAIIEMFKKKLSQRNHLILSI